MKMEELNREGDEKRELRHYPGAVSVWVAVQTAGKRWKYSGNVMLGEFGFEYPLAVCFGKLLRIS